MFDPAKSLFLVFQVDDGSPDRRVNSGSEPQFHKEINKIETFLIKLSNQSGASNSSRLAERAPVPTRSAPVAENHRTALQRHPLPYFISRSLMNQKSLLDELFIVLQQAAGIYGSFITTSHSMTAFTSHLKHSIPYSSKNVRNKHSYNKKKKTITELFNQWKKRDSKFWLQSLANCSDL